jgi:hypothetical protein
MSDDFGAKKAPITISSSNRKTMAIGEENRARGMSNHDPGAKKGPSTSSSSKVAASNSDANAVFLPAWFSPTEKDVICGTVL